MLSLHAVNHFYGTQHTLWDVSLDLLPGECTCVIPRRAWEKPRC
ncbi:Urea ABC transporter, ATPase protein UrtE [Cronobacter sakazakii 696]|nr:Urea ABC transporter, ATPase protein UrtE [Cronobacter sakazakii 696]